MFYVSVGQEFWVILTYVTHRIEIGHRGSYYGRPFFTVKDQFSL
jgi:hypothetical protein